MNLKMDMLSYCFGFYKMTHYLGAEKTTVNYTEIKHVAYVLPEWDP